MYDTYEDRVFQPVGYDDLEDPEQYCSDGFHPVHLDDHLGEGNRYKVLYKLGNGGLSTVWLCRDLETKTYVGLKILIAGISTDDCAELKLAGMDWDAKESGGNRLALPVNHFYINGPNGRHICLVLPVLGPRVSHIWQESENPGAIARIVAPQIVSGLQFLHRHHLCHGDLRPANILFKIMNLDELGEEELLKELGERETVPLLKLSGDDHELPQAPSYLVRPIHISKLPRHYLMDEIYIIDFGESYPSLAPPKELGIPASYCSPEILFNDPAGEPSDIWALACTLFEVRSGQQLFQGMFGDEDDILMQMVQLFGKFPEPWWSSWEKRDCWFDEEGKPSVYFDDGTATSQATTLEAILAEGYSFYPDSSNTKEDGKKTFSIPKEEIVVFADLLYQILKYSPGKRLTAEKIAEHKWFAIA
ncbi:kinase-like domain-containing protein [Tricladium varicosporioides]|nr:kinase-like domain-containing protein [Hymenoscyphus varicosporioides]